jgi:hypothetical protein
VRQISRGRVWAVTWAFVLGASCSVDTDRVFGGGEAGAAGETESGGSNGGGGRGGSSGAAGSGGAETEAGAGGAPDGSGGSAQAGAAGEPGTVACRDDTECRSYDADCEAIDADAGTPCAEDAGECDGEGECVVEGKKALGESCSDDSECGSGHCASTLAGDAVCCDSSCDGACQACGDDGHCDQGPEDDDACGTVRCPADSTCRDYPSSVTGGRCLPGGAGCGTGEQVCSFTAQGEGEECDASHVCDDSGGCTVAKRALGASCDADAECANDHCVDGVCCESSCDGQCMECRAGTGQCDVMPADDSSCPAVSCALDAECVTGSVPGNINTNRCKSVGECKTKADCGASYQPVGSACGANVSYPAADTVCDGAGACVAPTVTCGSIECSIENGVDCCFSRSGPSTPTFSCTEDCPSTPFSTMPPSTPVLCDEHTDCWPGEVCCLASASGGSDLSCAPEANCNRSLSQVTYYEVCQSPQFTRSCSKGTCNYEIPTRFPGWKFCDGF